MIQLMNDKQRNNISLPLRQLQSKKQIYQKKNNLLSRFYKSHQIADIKHTSFETYLILNILLPQYDNHDTDKIEIDWITMQI